MIETLNRPVVERAALIPAPVAPVAEPPLEIGFIPTRLHRRIAAAVAKAHRRRRPVCVYSESQIGKTVSLEEIARTEENTFYVRIPTGGGLADFLARLAEAVGIEPGPRLKARLFEQIQPGWTLLFDECHECIDRRNPGRGVRTLNFIRELWDLRRCALVLCGTNVFRDGLSRGAEARQFRQLVLRGLPALQLPAVPGAADLAAFAGAFGLDAAPAEEIGVRVVSVDDEGAERRVELVKVPAVLQAETVAAEGLGRWLLILQDAADLAREKRRALTWSLVVHAWHTFTNPAA